MSSKEDDLKAAEESVFNTMKRLFEVEDDLSRATVLATAALYAHLLERCADDEDPVDLIEDALDFVQENLIAALDEFERTNGNGVH